MDLVLRGVTVARRDAGAEPTWMYLRRVTELSTEFMSITELARSEATITMRFNIKFNGVVGQQWSEPLFYNLLQLFDCTWPILFQ